MASISPHDMLVEVEKEEKEAPAIHEPMGC